MIPALRNLQRLPIPLTADPIDQPMLTVDPAGPPAAEIAAERLGLAGAAKGVAATVPDQVVEAGEQLGVFGLPVEIVGPGSRPEDKLHGSISSCSSPCPASRSRIASSSRSALAGERNR